MYLFEITGAKAFVSRKGHDSVVWEFKVVEAEQTGDMSPNRIGAKVRSFYKLERDRDGDLNEDGERWMGRLKTLMANILGGDSRVGPDGEPEPVTDDMVTPFVAASMVKGTEYKVSTIDPDRREALMLEVATAKTKDGGLSMPQDMAEEAIEAGELNFADVRGVKVRCHARANDKGFVNLFWAPGV
tara:strand:- start:67 stop:624 length:558 start_codon:yes stop_codon:yes gene_type:complete